jgi:hypothetical protein
MSYSLIVPGQRGERLRAGLIAAMHEAYTENVARHAPDDLGDNNTTFGVNVTHNLRFLVERVVEDDERILRRRPRNGFFLEIDGRFALYFYKAPPGTTSIRGLRFDESEMKLQIARGNADQLKLDLDGLLPAETQLRADELPRHAVIVHFGGPELGFEQAYIGAPYRTATGACEWAWYEPFDTPSDGLAVHDDDDFPAGDNGFDDLRLRDEGDDASSDQLGE